MRRSQRAVLGIMLVAATIAPSLVPSASAGESKRSTWSSFLADRERFFEELSPAFVSCFQRRDSLIDPLSPIFHGCLDWHSAVHAAYSHLYVYRRTGDEGFLDLVEAQFAPQGQSLIPAEEAYQQAKAPDYALSENPYGFGWFLILARERELATGEKDLRPMAKFAADQLVSWFKARETDGDAVQYILNTAHPNYSWSLLNLDVWAKYTKDKALSQAVREAAQPLLDDSLDNLCPIKNDVNPKASGFQPACLMRLAAISQIKGDAADKWVAARLPNKALHIEPVTEPQNCHAGGLNFTRAFALYELYRSTGDTAYRDNYAELIRYHVGRPDLFIDESYAGDPGYMCYSHWVAQVGIRAISLSYGD